MSDSPNNIFESHAGNAAPLLLGDAFLEPLRKVMNESVSTRGCTVVDDLSFVTLCVHRVLESSKTGRDFLQCHGMPFLPGLNRSNYFKSLNSPRRLKMMSQLATAMRDEHLPGLRAHDDLLSAIPELDGWEIWASDGHAMAHATHDPRNTKDAYRAVHGIYSLDQRTGWCDFTALVPPTDRGHEHEIKTLKGLDKEQLRFGAAKGVKVLMNYDRAIVDFHFAYNLKQSKGVYIITEWKSNFRPMTVIAREIDRTKPINALVRSDETVFFNNTPGQWRRITAICPDTGETHVTLTNEMTLPPGVLNQVRRLRWNIEKAYDQQEQKLDERKAWTTRETGKRIQALAISLAHNLLRLFGARLKREENIEDTKVIKAWRKDLTKRMAAAAKADRMFPKELYLALYRPTEVSLQFIRWLRSTLFTQTCYRAAIQRLRPLMLKYL
ncbi:MAG: hypothetical protein RLZZ522_1544 [Verrucomicrobiota bacterium]|jgi:hypothetical protein